MVNQKLYRNPEKGKPGGVCAGVSEVYGVDVNICRIIAVAFFGLYFVA
jgi:phage shock protein C